MSLFVTDFNILIYRYLLFFHCALSFECPIYTSKLMLVHECPIIPRIMPAKLVTYNSQNYTAH